MMNLAGMDT